MTKVEPCTNAACLSECLDLRHTVFVEEQGVPVDMEVDEHDHTDALHMMIRHGGTVVGTGRVVPMGETAKIGRLAVAASVRGQGLGKKLVLALVQHAKESGFHTAKLDAQVTAIRFYESLGFSCVGEEFHDAGIPHKSMILLL